MGGHGGKREGAGRKTGSGKYGEPTTAIRIPASLVDDVKEFIRLGKVNERDIPLYTASQSVSSVLIEFVGPDEFIDLKSAILSEEKSFFAIRAINDLMKDCNIKDGDVLIMDRSVKPKSSDIVAIVIDDVLTIGRFFTERRKHYLAAFGPSADKFPLNKEQYNSIWGVMIGAIYNRPMPKK